MGYPEVGGARHAPCEICAGVVVAEAVRGGGVLVRCTTCGHLVRDLRDCPANHRDLAYGGEAHLDRIRLDLTYRALVRDGVPASVFEVGYGAGSMLRRFLDGGARVAGADPDQLGLSLDPQVRARARLHHGRIEDLPAGSPPVDLAYGIHVLEHVADPIGALRGARGLLAPGGRASFLTPAGDGVGLARWGKAWWMLEDPTHVRFFTADSLARAAERAGFVDVEVRRLLLDSLSVEAASLARRLAPRPRRDGVLSHPAVTALTVASLPAVLAERALRPRARATLHLVARVP